jgi:hypothetical protein
MPAIVSATASTSPQRANTRRSVATRAPLNLIWSLELRDAMHVSASAVGGAIETAVTLNLLALRLRTGVTLSVIEGDDGLRFAARHESGHAFTSVWPALLNVAFNTAIQLLQRRYDDATEISGPMLATSDTERHLDASDLLLADDACLLRPFGFRSAAARGAGGRPQLRACVGDLAMIDGPKIGGQFAQFIAIEQFVTS